MANRVVWVTGASSGLGKSTAEALSKAGWQVIGGARSFKGDKIADSGMTCLPLDVTSQKSLETIRYWYDRGNSLFPREKMISHMLEVICFGLKNGENEGPGLSYTHLK